MTGTSARRRPAGGLGDEPGPQCSPPENTSAGAYDDAVVPSFSPLCRRFLAAVSLVVVMAGCSGGGDDGGGGGRAGRGEDGEPVYAFSVLATDVQAMAPQAPPFTDDLKWSVTDALNAYLATAVVEPLRTGQPARRLEAAFTAAALGRISAPGPERAAVLEEGTPVTGEVHQDRANARLTALTAPGGEVVLVTAQVDLGHTVEADGGPVDVVRSGELVLVAEGGAWRIDAFDMRTVRNSR